MIKKFKKLSLIALTLLAVLPVFIMSCSNKNITWYQKETVRNIEKIDREKYKIEIGISAQIFYFDRKSENSESVFTILNYSFKKNKAIKIGIENNTNKILFAKRLNE